MPQKKLLKLLKKSGPQLHGLLTKLTLREDIAEDLMQELFIKLSNSPNFDRVENPLAYAAKTAMNLAFDYRRKKKITTCSLNSASMRSADAALPLETIVKAEQLQLTLDAVGRLEEPYRQIIVMRYLEQQPLQHIAHRIGKDTHHIRSLCHRARNKLKLLLNTSDSFVEKEAKNG